MSVSAEAGIAPPPARSAARTFIRRNPTIVVGTLLLGIVVLLGRWSAALPVTAGAVLSALGVLALVAPAFTHTQVADLVGGAGTALTPPTAEGGRLRSQDMRTTGDPAGLNGSLIRIDPTTGAGVSGNPFFSSADTKARRIIAYGFRNPFRMTIRPGTNEAWIGDVGNARWEEIDRHQNPTPTGRGLVSRTGWPAARRAALTALIWSVP